MDIYNLDLAYRWLFGMLPSASMIQLMNANGIKNIPIPGHGVLNIKDIVDQSKLSINPALTGFACASQLEDVYGEYTNSMRCADQQRQSYKPIIDYILSLIATDNFAVVMVDLANMLAGQIYDYDEALEQLPVQMATPSGNQPIIYIVIKPSSALDSPTFYGNKVLLPAVCLIPTAEGTLVPCAERGIGETDDILLILIYQYIQSQYPYSVHILSGDQYKWMDLHGLPRASLHYLHLEPRPTGLSPYTLVPNRFKPNRMYAFSLIDGQGKFGTEGSAAPASHKYPELCPTYTYTGYCPYGYDCHYAHGLAELPPGIIATGYKSRPCASMVNTGSCPNGISCNFMHPGEWL